jgi:hypothetical protein
MMLQGAAYVRPRTADDSTEEGAAHRLTPLPDTGRDSSDGLVTGAPQSQSEPSPDVDASQPLRAPSPAQRNAARQAERRLVVYLEEPQRRWLRGIEADALQDDVRLSASAIVRMAIDELRARGVEWRDLAARTRE